MPLCDRPAKVGRCSLTGNSDCGSLLSTRASRARGGFADTEARYNLRPIAVRCEQVTEPNAASYESEQFGISSTLGVLLCYHSVGDQAGDQRAGSGRPAPARLKHRTAPQKPPIPRLMEANVPYGQQGSARS